MGKGKGKGKGNGNGKGEVRVRVMVMAMATATVLSIVFVIVLTFGVARLTSRTRKLSLVGGCLGRDRPSRALPMTCPNLNNLLK